MTTTSSSSCWIKGYLPVRLKLPPETISITTNTTTPALADVKNDETFFFVKEHSENNSNNSNSKEKTRKNNKSSQNKTLFVANAPTIPGIRTQLLLKALLGRYGEVTRVTVIPNPTRRHSNPMPLAKTSNETASSLLSVDPSIQAWLHPCLHPLTSSSTNHHKNHNHHQHHVDGKFAHVLFASHKEMKKTLLSLERIMMMTMTSGDIRTTKTIRRGNGNDEPVDEEEEEDGRNGVTLRNIELQTLADETHRQLQEEWESDNDDHNSTSRLSGGIHAVAQRYQNAFCRSYILQSSSTRLLAECNQIMEEYEQAEQEAQRARLDAMHQPDEDGFITVTYGTHVQTETSQQALEQQQQKDDNNDDEDDDNEDDGNGEGQQQRRRRGGVAGLANHSKKRRGGASHSSRSRKKKQSTGASELSDFYRFQTKERRKRSLQELRERFEEDLAKIQKRKDERQFKPFSSG